MPDPLTARALDAAVATALGWQCVAWCPEFPTAVGCAPARDPHQDVEPVPLFSEDIGAAWGLVERMVARGFWCQVKTPFEPALVYIAGFTPHGTTGWNGRPDFKGHGDTAAEAICRAFLALNAGTAIAVPQVAQPTEDAP